eukprot:3329511-Pleurochrysis_carterae.AAC.5
MAEVESRMIAVTDNELSSALNVAASRSAPIQRVEDHFAGTKENSVSVGSTASFDRASENDATAHTGGVSHPRAREAPTSQRPPTKTAPPPPTSPSLVRVVGLHLSPIMPFDKSAGSSSGGVLTSLLSTLVFACCCCSAGVILKLAIWVRQRKASKTKPILQPRRHGVLSSSSASSATRKTAGPSCNTVQKRTSADSAAAAKSVRTTCSLHTETARSYHALGAAPLRVTRDSQQPLSSDSRRGTSSASPHNQGNGVMMMC